MTGLSHPSPLVSEEQAPTLRFAFQRRSAKQLWLAVHLPDLALFSVARKEPDKPTAIVDPQDRQRRIVAVNEKAERLGISPGLTVSAAMAFSDSLELLERSALAERENLESLAAWCYRLTPIVSLQEPEGLLLEVQGSLKLYSGLEAIKQKLAAEIRRRRWSFRLSTAPTPLAALWLARLENKDIPNHSEIRRYLAALPVAVTGWSDRAQLLLRQMGVESIGDCLRLPRAGFARRLGKDCLDDLDKAMGRQPDFRAEFRTRESLSWTVEFAVETTEQSSFVQALETIVPCLVSELRQRQSQVSAIELRFHHASAADPSEADPSGFDLSNAELPGQEYSNSSRRGFGTLVQVRFVEPVHEQQRILQPLIARLERIELPRAAVAFSLDTGPLLPLSIDALALFTSLESNGQAPVSEFTLVECLRGRFGMDRIQGLGAVAEHRPEHAWEQLTASLCRSPAAVIELAAWRHERPLWILPEPLSLGAAVVGLHKAYVPQPQSKPERIESGWWDGRDIRRDYYMLTAPNGEKLWVYQDCLTRAWYLHGIFG